MNRISTASPRFLAPMLVALALGCADSSDVEFETPIRPQLDQIVLAGELGLDSQFDKIIRPKKIPRREVRRPLEGLYEVVKGSDLFSRRTVTFMPLGNGFSSRECRRGENGPCPGRPQLSDAINQAGIDVVSLAGIAPGDDSELEETRRLVEADRICVVGGKKGDLCLEKLGDVTVAFAGLSCDEADSRESLSSRAREIAVAARQKQASHLVLSVAMDSKIPREARREILDDLSDASEASVVMGHHDGPAEGVDIRGGRFVVYNLGPLVSYEEPDSSVSLGNLFRVHFKPKAISWIEAIPIKLKKRRSRLAFLDESREALSQLRGLLGPGAASRYKEEFGRGIFDLEEAQ